MSDVPASAVDISSIMRSRQFGALLVLAAVVGVVVSLAAWGFLELVFHLQRWVYTNIPEDLGYDSPPLWWSLPILALAGVVAAFAIVRLPGRGGHIPAEGLNPAPTQPIEVPGVILAAVATIGLGMVLGPEAPLIAMGGGLGLYAIHLTRRDAPEEVGTVIAASATFAALAFLFGSPIIAAVILIEAAGLGGSRLPLVLVPGLLASGIGSLIWIGMGSWTGLSTSAISISPLHLPTFPQPDLVDFGWTILLAGAVAVVTFAIFRIARKTHRVAARRPFLILPAIGIAVSGLAIAFSQATDKGVNEVLFSGQSSLGPLVANPGTWSLSTLALLIAFKGLAYGLSLGSFRGGPVFPSLFLGAAGGLMAAQLPGFSLTPAVAVGIGAAVVSVLRLPLAAVVLAVVLTFTAGPGAAPLIIVGVVVAYLATLALSAREASPPRDDRRRSRARSLLDRVAREDPRQPVLRSRRARSFLTASSWAVSSSSLRISGSSPAFRLSA
jgi:chloride channel protein, CIC family